jgi:hypothetical protein
LNLCKHLVAMDRMSSYKKDVSQLKEHKKFSFHYLIGNSLELIFPQKINILAKLPNMVAKATPLD